jgi:hypothetical protein
MRIEALKVLRVKLPDRVVLLRPGITVDLDDEQALRLMRKAPHAVRGVDVQVEPGPQRLAYWEDRRGIIKPGVVVWLGKVSDRFWVWIESESDGGRWIHESLLRSKASYEAQHKRER